MCVGIAHLSHDVPYDLRDVDVAIARHLTRYHDHAGGHQGLDGHARTLVLTDDMVQDAIGYLIAQLVGMAHCHGFGGEKILAHTDPSSLQAAPV